MENLPQVQQEGSFFFDVQKFEHAQRIAKIFTTATLVPAHFRENIGNCLIALNYAARVKADPFTIMQNMYVVHGKPGIEAKLAIALLNQSKRFTPLKFKYNETKTECFAYATEKESGEECEGPTVSMEMAAAEGWSSKSGSKWKTMPHLMLMYRSATFFIRMYAPDVLLGMNTRDELHDMSGQQPHREAPDSKYQGDTIDLTESLKGQAQKSPPPPMPEPPPFITEPEQAPMDEEDIYIQGAPDGYLAEAEKNLKLKYIPGMPMDSKKRIANEISRLAS